MGGRPGQACPRRLRGLCTGPAHSSAGTRQRPSSAPLHQPSPSTPPLSCLYASDPSLPDGHTNFYRSDDVAAVAYFYLDRPEGALPPLASAAERLAALRPPDKK